MAHNKNQNFPIVAWLCCYITL